MDVTPPTVRADVVGKLVAETGVVGIVGMAGLCCCFSVKKTFWVESYQTDSINKMACHFAKAVEMLCFYIKLAANPPGRGAKEECRSIS